MNDRPAETLRALIKRHGRGIARSPLRCAGLLNDHLGGEHRRERFLLVQALREGVVSELAAAGGRLQPAVRDILIATQARRLQESCGFAPDTAYWAVEAWAYALSGTMKSDDSSAPPTPPNAAPGTVMLEGYGRFSTIREAIAHAAHGARIVLGPGRYEESLVIDRSIELLGDGARAAIVIDAHDEACLRMLTSSRARVAGLTLQTSIDETAPSDRYTVEVSRGTLELDDCVVAAGACAAIGVRGRSAHVTIRRCSVSSQRAPGLVFEEEGAGDIERSDILSGTVGVVIGENAAPSIRDCVVSGRAYSGVVIEDRGRGTFANCTITDAMVGITIKNGAAPEIRECHIRDSLDAGVLTHGAGGGLIAGCVISGSMFAGVVIRDGAAPTIRGCTVRDGKHSGVWIENAGGVIETTALLNNALDGVSVSGGDGPLVHRCRIVGNGRYGVLLQNQSRASVEECELAGNAGGSWSRSADSALREAGNRES